MAKRGPKPDGQRIQKLGPDDIQTCTKCGVPKKCKGNFSPAPSSASGWQWWCNTCLHDQRKQRASDQKLALKLMKELEKLFDEYGWPIGKISSVLVRWKNRHKNLPTNET